MGFGWYRRVAAFALIVAAVFANCSAKDLSDLNFKGRYRAGPKTSIVRQGENGPILDPEKSYSDLGMLLDGLVPDSVMLEKYPDLASKWRYPNEREPEERKNVAVTGWVYAIKFEGGKKGDNDFHVILGSSAERRTARYMTVEVSGLPSAGQDRPVLREVRQKLLELFPKEFVAGRFLRTEPPRKVAVKGSLFYDGEHDYGTRPGPSYAKPQTLWEIHPVYSLEAAK